MKQEIENSTNEYMGIRQKQQEQIDRNRIILSDAQMQETYPEWQRWKGQLVNYAQQLGFKPTQLVKQWDTAFAQTLLKAFQYDQNKQTAAAKRVKQLQRPKQPDQLPALQRCSVRKQMMLKPPRKQRY